MAISRMSLVELIQKAGVKGDIDFLREGLRVLAEAIMEIEVSEKTMSESPSVHAPRSSSLFDTE